MFLKLTVEIFTCGDSGFDINYDWLNLPKIRKVSDKAISDSYEKYKPAMQTHLLG